VHRWQSYFSIFRHLGQLQNAERIDRTNIFHRSEREPGAETEQPETRHINGRERSQELHHLLVPLI
jgi:hypothetical protein